MFHKKSIRHFIIVYKKTPESCIKSVSYALIINLNLNLTGYVKCFIATDVPIA